jgi:uncharacterized membrane protein
MIKLFIIFGLLGLLIEIVWTGATSIIRRDFRMISSTSLWMFLIYGTASFMMPLCDVLSDKPMAIRGAAYMLLIFAVEFASGSLLKWFHACPWDYSGAKYNVRGVIRVDYAPAWFAVGLLFEAVYRYFQGYPLL